MPHVQVHEGAIRLRNPVFVEGLPGMGLVGKIAVDHMIDQFEMTYYASIECPGLPALEVYHADDPSVLLPVRIYADEQRNLLALQSEVPVSPRTVADFADCLTTFLVNHEALPLYVSGLERERVPDDRSVYGVAVGAEENLLAEAELDPPNEAGIWSGPSGALLNVARTRGVAALGLLVDSDPRSPDPEAACRLIDRGIAPLAGLDVDTDPLRERATQIREQQEEFAAEMRQPDDNESSKAESLRMYQ